MNESSCLNFLTNQGSSLKIFILAKCYRNAFFGWMVPSISYIWIKPHLTKKLLAIGSKLVIWSIPWAPSSDTCNGTCCFLVSTSRSRFKTWQLDHQIIALYFLSKKKIVVVTNLKFCRNEFGMHYWCLNHAYNMSLGR